MPRIHYFATERDHTDLVAFIQSLDAQIVPAELRSGAKIEDASDSHPGAWYISQIPMSQIREHPATPGFPDGGNPLIRWARAFVRGQNLIEGTFEWTDFSPLTCARYNFSHEKVVEIGKEFSKIQRWIRKNYTNLDGGNFWFAPEAARLRTVEGYGAGSNFADDVTFEQLVIGDGGKIIETRRLNDLSEFEDR
jgi:hypothetical protein